MMAPMRLFHIPGSRSTRVLWTLEEIGEPFDLRILTREEKGSEEHAVRHPLGRVPVLELDDGQCIFESAAICLHLGDLFPESGMLPPVGTYERALTYQWTVFAMSELEPATYGWMRARRAEQDETELAEKFLTISSALEGSLKDRTWLAGENFTIADILCSSILSSAIRRDFIPESSATLHSYFARAQERPANLRAEAVRTLTE
jgi:glutathione S-transferase